MLTSVQGVYRKGRIELDEPPKDIQEETPVIVMFLDGGPIDLRERGISEAQARYLSAQLAVFADEWNSPEMSIYDNYDTAKPKR